VSRHLEIERKFLVKRLPKGWRSKPAARLVQGYFPTKHGVEIRLRQEDSHHFITVKAGTGHRRQEEEIEIPKSKFRALWPLTHGAQVSKTRHEIAHQRKTIEMDVYHGRHRGLVTAEVEFDSLAECRAFEPPAWLGREITGSRQYANATLARRRGLPRRAKTN